MAFATDLLDYELPSELIAQRPAESRTASRMLVVHRASGTIEDRAITDFPAYLRPSDALVINDTQVVPARFQVVRSTGGRIDGLFLGEAGTGVWEVLLRGGARVQTGEELSFAGGEQRWTMHLEARGERGRWRVRVVPPVASEVVLDDVGRMPLPPYIKRDRRGDERDLMDRDRYQTVYARRPGAVAAPTAGLHFTETMLESIGALGVTVQKVTLHVGYGTFAPLEADTLDEHPMHAEQIEMSDDVAHRLARIRQEQGRILAVGTTSVRVLESVWQQNRWSEGYRGATRLFCFPPYEFGGVDALLTNFHLPRSTLLALVMAFAGVDLTRRAYAEAVARRYRFFSYGDAMLIL